METPGTITIDLLSVVVGLGVAGLSLCLVLLALGRWCWNRLVRLKRLSIERIDGQPLWMQLSIDESPKPSLWSKLRELGK